MSARLLAFGDVHGCDRALAAVLEMVAPRPDDTLVFVGDVVDRGPASRQVIDRLLALRETCKVVVLMGNHEEMMRNAIAGRGLMHAWLEAGGRATLESYGGSIEDIPPAHIRFLLSTQPFYETEREIFVHAGLESEVSLANQTSEFLRWKHLGGSERPHVSGKRVICGHTPQEDGRPYVQNGWVCLDTFAHGGQWLSCLDIGPDRIYQAAESGARREFDLADAESSASSYRATSPPPAAPGG